MFLADIWLVDLAIFRLLFSAFKSAFSFCIRFCEWNIDMSYIFKNLAV